MRFGLGYAYLRQGDSALAFKLLAQGLEKCREKEFPNALPYIAAAMGSACVGLGRPADAVPLLDEAFDGLAALGLVCFRSFVLTSSAQAYLGLGRTAKALKLAEQSVALARAHQERGWEAWALKVIGDILSHERASFRRAADAYRQAVGSATALGMNPLLAHCQLALRNLKLPRKKHARERD